MVIGPLRADATDLSVRSLGDADRQILLPPDPDSDELELTVVLPCLNEAETLATCIGKARASMAELGIKGEVLVADNGSTDGSQEIAIAHGARVVDVPVRGYGAALGHGIAAASGRFVIMADADDSYALDDLGPFVDELRRGADLVMGNRFAGGVAPGAMPPLHRYLGNPVLSFLGRLLFKVPVGDFHCGMRGFRRDRMQALGLRTTGMEFASEMVVRSRLNRLRIAEVPTTLRPDGRSREPHLRTWRDGWRHLRFLLAFSPRWLLWYPAVTIFALGALLMVWAGFTHRPIGSIGLGVHTMLAAATAMVLGAQLAGLALLSQAYAAALGLLPRGRRLRTAERTVLRWGLPGGLVLIVGGVVCFAGATWQWGSSASFGQLDPARTMQLPIIGMLGIVLGVTATMLSFALSLTRIDEI